MSHLPVLLCLSHLRWNFVYQRPQHLMSRMARDHRVLFLEEPIRSDGEAFIEHRLDSSGVEVLIPHVPAEPGYQADEYLRTLIDDLFEAEKITPQVLWYYSPMAVSFTEHLQAPLVVYDCMDELSAFRGAPPQLIQRERELIARADLLFTGGHSLYEAKRELHDDAHAFPSSVEIGHFAQARQALEEPLDQADIPHPRLGFYGVIDERFDVALIDTLSRQRPDWQFVLIGPVVKIDAATLPYRPNIHYLGPKVYDELPYYLAGWDVALLPFALNESTRFISPTKTPEYLAGGCPAVSTPIRDVIRGYGDSGVVHIADSPEAFAAACETALWQSSQRQEFLAAADAALGNMSWDNTWNRMKELMNARLDLQLRRRA